MTTEPPNLLQINEVVTALKELWFKNPHLRFGQVMAMLCRDRNTWISGQDTQAQNEEWLARIAEAMPPEAQS